MDGDIRVTLLSIAGGKVRLGITAHPAIGVHRAEISDRARKPLARRGKVPQLVLEARAE
jgi:carbon storage regulator CsrA